MAPRMDSDTQLLARACDGDGEAFAEFVGRQQRHVREYLHRRNPSIRPSELEDLTQEVFTRTWRVKGKYRGQASAQTFLFAIAKNVLSEHWRHSRRAQSLGVDPPAQQQRDSPTELRELLRIVSRALEQLTSKQKQAFSLVVVNEVPVKEAALQAGTSVKAIRKRVESARDHLRRGLSACKKQCSYDCPSLRSCPAEAVGTFCLRFLIRKYL